MPMIKQVINTSFFFLFAFLQLQAQVRPRCAVPQNKPETLQNYLKIQEILAKKTSTFSKNTRITNDGLIRIPVVVHVIHNNAAGIIGGSNNRNISDEQIFSQIKALNEDFRRKPNTFGYNENPNGADMEIEFFLAQIDPDGKPTNGIVRKYYNKRQFDVFDELALISSISYWDANRYLNIWVADLAGTYLGYGEFPIADVEGLEIAESPDETDGVFVDYEVFGRKIGTSTIPLYDFGRTLTHEIGHWLGLIHIWGDRLCGTDYCEDTPPAEKPNYSGECIDVFSFCTGRASLNMSENYMDYTPDSCMNTFTIDQKNRVRAILELSKRRSRLINFSTFLLPYSEVPALKILKNPDFKQNMAIQVQMPMFSNFTIRIYNLAGQLVYGKEFIDYPGVVINLNEIDISSGHYIVQLQTSNEALSKKMLVF